MAPPVPMDGNPGRRRHWSSSSRSHTVPAPQPISRAPRHKRPRPRGLIRGHAVKLELSHRLPAPVALFASFSSLRAWTKFTAHQPV